MKGKERKGKERKRNVKIRYLIFKDFQQNRNK